MNSRMLTLSAAIVAALTATAVPEVTNVTMSQDIGRLVTVTYHLAGAPAIVTMDVVTNGVSIGDENVYRLSPPSGAVSKLIAEDGDYTITWKADRAWPDHKITDKSAQVVVTAWDPAVPPDYMVVDLLVNSNVTYYTSAKALPGGLLDVDDYRTTKMVMRRIHAADVEWTMGSVAADGRQNNETAHRVCMADDYYMAVFPITQGQYCSALSVQRGSTFGFSNEGYWQKRIGDGLHYSGVRGAKYPAEPADGTLIKTIRNKAGVCVDLPGEAQWEFACRAGHDDTCWGDGTPLAGTSNAANADTLPGRFAGNNVDFASGEQSTVDDKSGTPIAGSYNGNSWGIYDMHGGVEEFCLDVYQADITANSTGAVVTGEGTTVVTRGGAWYRSWSWARAAYRASSGWNDGGSFGWGGIRGIRLAASIPAER